MRTVERAGLALGLVALALGLAFAAGSAFVAGDWWLARQPWIGIGLNLIVVGLVASGVFAVVLDVVEPLGWLRLLAVPPALLVGAMWAFYLIFGLPTTGHGGPDRDITTILYSVPSTLILFIVLTLLLALPLLIARIRASHSQAA
jgi:hypothetical protein